MSGETQKQETGPSGFLIEVIGATAMSSDRAEVVGMSSASLYGQTAFDSLSVVTDYDQA